jgi:putative ABC transport system substrate-binding protein
MRRRELITLLGGAAASSLLRPHAARAQQPALPVVGMLNSGSRDAYASRNAAFLEGLGETGFVEGRNVAIEHRYADDHYDRLPDLAAELVHRPVAVLFAAGGGVAPQATKAATATIPIVFTGGFDPVKAGLVASLNQPGGNVTGTTFLTNALETKRLGILHELVPQAGVIGVLMNPKNASAETVRADLNEAARGLGIALRIAQASSEGEFDAAFAGFDRDGVGAVLVASDAVFSGNAKSLVTLAERHTLPTFYFVREFPAVGGLMSYGTSFDDAWRLAGGYVGRILKGEKPANMPVVQSSKFETVINLKTAKALGLSIPQTLLATADEVIE